MTKKHFESLACAMRASKPIQGQREDITNAVVLHTQWLRDVEAIADVCASGNGRFDRGRFLAACTN